VFRCERPSRYAGWLLADGRVVPARCGAPNKCAYCAYQATIENAIVVQLDAERFGHPRLGGTLTTVDPQHSMAAFRRDTEKAIKALRGRVEGLQYLGMVEWTTGRGVRSGGARRVHQHLLLKGADPSLCDELESCLRDVWSARTGASRVELRELRSPAGATAYLIHHHRKREQSPPPGWSGKRMRPSRGYYGCPVSDLRAEAQQLLRSKRLRRVARRLVQWDALDGAPDELVEAEMKSALSEAQRAASRVTFVKFDQAGAIVRWRRVAS
jgi:hypothetical protein